ncbi:MAG: type II toxin-antitoxin system HicA family toxin [Patescibacteria group bacterium]
MVCNPKGCQSSLDGYTKLSVPNHKELDRGLLRALIRDAGITVEEFVGLKKAK